MLLSSWGEIHSSSLSSGVQVGGNDLYPRGFFKNKEATSLLVRQFPNNFDYSYAAAALYGLYQLFPTEITLVPFLRNMICFASIFALRFLFWTRITHC